MDDIALVRVGPENVSECGIGCLADRKHPGYRQKLDWLRCRFSEGLRILLYRDGKGKPLAFLEYVPGECAWRRVEAKGWMFVHCLWVFPRGQKIGGVGSRMIQAVLEDARKARARGVAAMVSDGAWMAGVRVFLKNGFDLTAEADRFQLVTYRLKKGPAPRFRELRGPSPRFRGLHIVYAPQCPMLPKSVNDVSALAARHGLKTKVTVLKSAREAQNAPSHYGVFSLVWNGRLLADHYVSAGRFQNILRKEVLST